MSSRAIRSLPVIGLLLAAGAASPVFAGSTYDTAGDGSGANNPDLLRGGYATDCNNCAAPDDAPPILPDEPPFRTDYSLALRGSYVQATTGSYFEASAVPTLTLSGQGLRSAFNLTTSAEVTQSTIDSFRVQSLRIALAGGYDLDDVTSLAASGELAFSQASPNAPGNLPGVIASPQVIAGQSQASIARDLGFIDIQLRGNASRTVYGPTTMAGPLAVDNSWQSNSQVGAGLRIGHQVTPIMGMFGDIAASTQYFDAPSPTLLLRLDGQNYAAKAGVNATWGTILSAEASIGIGLRRFDAGLADVSATLYDVSLTFRPDETLTINAALGTTIAPPANSAQRARVAYSAIAAASYKINPWLGVRGSAGWYRYDPAGPGASETGFSLGAGADYALNENVTLQADYSFTHAEQAPAAPNDVHRWTLGMIWKK